MTNTSFSKGFKDVRYNDLYEGYNDNENQSPFFGEKVPQVTGVVEHLGLKGEFMVYDHVFACSRSSSTSENQVADVFNMDGWTKTPTPQAMIPLWRPPSTGRTRSLSTTSTLRADASRPMTAVRGAGYTSRGSKFDSLSQGTRSSTPTSQIKDEALVEHQIQEMEWGINNILEESAEESLVGHYSIALEKAKEAGKKERLLCKHREQAGLAEEINTELMYSVYFNLAYQYQMNHLYSEALNVYSQIVKSKQLVQGGRLRINMGNIYYKQEKYSLAIKMFHMALDQTPNSYKETRYRIMRNIGNVFMRTGQYQDAMQSYEAVLKIKIDHQTGYNLVVCSYILGNTEKMKASFTKMLLVRHYDPDSDDDIEANDAYMLQIDELLEELKGRQTCAYKYILAAARLIAPVIGASFLEGYDWLIDMLNNQQYTSLAHEIEMDKAIQQLHRGNYGEAILLLKDFERKEKGLKARAATNLSFLYFLEGDISNAQKHAELAVQANSFNACALVNQANCLFSRGDLEGAKVMFLEAIEVEAECVEANYNLGLTYKKLGLFEAALTTFKKLSNWLPSNNDVLLQMGHVNEMMGNFQEAIKWLEILVTKAMHDAGVLAKLGNLYSICNDEAKALHFYNESHRTYPVNIDIVSWLGAYYVKNEVYEKAMPFFELASKIQPHEAKWQLMLASCYRKTGMYTIAFSKYKEILGKHPDNVECLRHLVHMCNSLGKREEVKEYQIRLHKAETNEQANSRSQPMRLERVEQTAIRMDMKDISRHLFVSENSGQMLDNRTEVACLPCSFLHGTQQSGRPSTSPSLTVTHQAKERKPAMKNEKIDDGEWELGDDFLPM